MLDRSACAFVAYAAEREILHGIDLAFPQGSFTALVGESGCGKSTVASILMGRSRAYGGSVAVGGVELGRIAEDSLMEKLTYVSHQSYLFKGTVRENLLMGAPGADDGALWAVLERVNLADSCAARTGWRRSPRKGHEPFGRAVPSGSRSQRALLHDGPVYIFDEATSNIDVEVKNDIMREIHKLAETKTVILISHRLVNVAGADRIYVLESGAVAESGSHEALLLNGGLYAKLRTAQQSLENYGKEAV